MKKVEISRKSMWMRRLTVLTTLGIGLSPAVEAHHSSAMFDRDKLITIDGTVKEFQWTNPHILLWVLASGKGDSALWAIEGGSPGMLAQVGWSKHLLNAGDKVTVLVHPLKDGRMGGSFVKLTTADGHVLTDMPAPPPGK